MVGCVIERGDADVRLATLVTAVRDPAHPTPLVPTVSLTVPVSTVLSAIQVWIMNLSFAFSHGKNVGRILMDFDTYLAESNLTVPTYFNY